MARHDREESLEEQLAWLDAIKETEDAPVKVSASSASADDTAVVSPYPQDPWLAVPQHDTPPPPLFRAAVDSVYGAAAAEEPPPAPSAGSEAGEWPDQAEPAAARTVSADEAFMAPLRPLPRPEEPAPERAEEQTEENLPWPAPPAWRPASREDTAPQPAVADTPPSDDAGEPDPETSDRPVWTPDRTEPDRPDPADSPGWGSGEHDRPERGGWASEKQDQAERPGWGSGEHERPERLGWGSGEHQQPEGPERGGSGAGERELPDRVGWGAAEQERASEPIRLRWGSGEHARPEWPSEAADRPFGGQERPERPERPERQERAQEAVEPRHRQAPEFQRPEPRRRPAPAPVFNAPPKPPVTGRPTADSLDPETLLRGRRNAPSKGWRRLIYKASGGWIKPGEPPEVRRRRALMARARTPVAAGHHRVAVLSLKGGVGKTTTTVGLGATLAQMRGDRVIAIDANPDRGTLSDKLELETSATVRDLLNEREQVKRYVDIRAFTSQAPSRLEVLASDRDPSVSEAFSGADYQAVSQVLENFYSICITDCGTGLLHSAMGGVLGLADQIVLVSSPSVDGARAASATLDWLEAHHYGGLVREATVVLCSVRPRSKSAVDIKKLEAHFAARCRAVIQVPYDPHLEEGAEIDLDRLQEDTREAFLQVAASVGDGFAGSHE
ncbi:AAA family ATPase [Nonomuraea sp. NPDC049725]|uniref:MinD/ParA family ATP-binding protein n=1 Tax=Nonomuraea sp. NPDC049725 TaxID=3154508 RepID=UPI003446E390